MSTNPTSFLLSPSQWGWVGVGWRLNSPWTPLGSPWQGIRAPTPPPASTGGEGGQLPAPFHRYLPGGVEDQLHA